MNFEDNNFEDNNFEAVAAGSSVENYLAAVVFRPLLQDTLVLTPNSQGL